MSKSFTSTDIIFNSVPRSGNNFLAECIDSALTKNIKNENNLKKLPNKTLVLDTNKTFILHPFFHIPSMLKLEQSDSFIQFTNVRSPMEVIKSYCFIALSNSQDDKTIENVLNGAHYNFKGMIKSITENYLDYLTIQIQNKNAFVIEFDKLVNDPDSIISFVLSKINIDYENKVSSEEVKDVIKNRDAKTFGSLSNQKVANMKHHGPHDIQKTKMYETLTKQIEDEEDFAKLQTLYMEVSNGSI